LSIKAHSVTKLFGSPVPGVPPVEAVRGVSLDINEGSCTVIFGPTGSGKTTLLSLLSGLARPNTGEIIFHNLHLSQCSDRTISSFRDRHIGYVPQNLLLIKDLTVLENILSPNAFSTRRLKQLKADALQLLERLNLQDKAGFKPGALSGGESRKVMIARALVKRPAFMFADEPVSDLDDESMRVALKMFSELRGEGSAIVIASHKPLSLGRKADLYIINKGKIEDHRRGGGR